MDPDDSDVMAVVNQLSSTSPGVYMYVYCDYSVCVCVCVPMKFIYGPIMIRVKITYHNQTAT